MTLAECKMSSYSHAVATLIFLMLPVCLMEISIETERHSFRNRWINNISFRISRCCRRNDNIFMKISPSSKEFSIDVKYMKFYYLRGGVVLTEVTGLTSWLNVLQKSHAHYLIFQSGAHYCMYFHCLHFVEV